MKIKDIPLTSLIRADYNPPGRVSEKRLRALVKSMTEVGLIYPIAVTPKNEVIDGHRRLAAAKVLKWPTIPCLIITGKRDTIYASVNTSAQKPSGNDSLGVWLKNPDAVMPRSAVVFETMEANLGRPLLKKMYAAGMSASSYRLAVGLCTYCDLDADRFTAKAIHWMLKFRQGMRAYKAMEANQDPLMLADAIRHMRPIKIEFSVAS